ncbi:MAG: hypothetical protein IJ342_08645 [Muribaculaceae bacterium]|nr:hypothetical protein [Muribaculaceae bacterium]MBQ9018175.1 hypothetical protein [Candidatus Saccharibacteria bacterium]
MKHFAEDLKKIYSEERIMLVLMIVNLIASVALMVFSIVNLNPNIAIVKIGYGDIGGYRDGAWTDMIAFPLLAIVFGVFHNFIALNIFHRRGAGMTKFFLITTSVLIAGAFIVLIRLLKEG